MFFSVVCFLLTSRMASNGTLKRLLKINGIQVRIEPVAKTTVAKSFLKATPKVGKAGKGSGSDPVHKADPQAVPLPSKAGKSSKADPEAVPSPSRYRSLPIPKFKAMSKSAMLQAAKAESANQQGSQGSGSDLVGKAGKAAANRQGKTR